MSTPHVHSAADELLAQVKERDRARLRIYIGAGAHLGRTRHMLNEAQALAADGVDVVIGYLAPSARLDQDLALKGLEVIPSRTSHYGGVSVEEPDVDAIVRRKPRTCIVDELASTAVPDHRRERRYEDVIDILDAGIHVITAVNIEHIESLKDAIARETGVRATETIPEAFLDRADDVMQVDIAAEELERRSAAGPRPMPAERVGTHWRHGIQPHPAPERVMVWMSATASAARAIRAAAALADRLGSTWYAAHVETLHGKADHGSSGDAGILQGNVELARSLGAMVVPVEADRASDGLIAFARREKITRVILGQGARSRLELLWHGSTLEQLLGAVPQATVEIVPHDEP